MKRMLNNMVTQTEQKNNTQKDKKINFMNQNVRKSESTNHFDLSNLVNQSNLAQKVSFQNSTKQSTETPSNSEKQEMNDQIGNNKQEYDSKAFNSSNNQRMNQKNQTFNQNIGISNRTSTFSTNNSNIATNTMVSTVKPPIKLSLSEERNQILLQINSNKQVVQVLSQYLSAQKKKNLNHRQNDQKNTLLKSNQQSESNSLHFDPKRDIWTVPLSHFTALSVHLKKHFKFDPIPRDTIRILLKSDVLEEKTTNEEDSEYLKNIKRFLLPHQSEVLNAPERVLLADEMGLGKTISALALAARHTADWPVLIVTPGGLCDNWFCEVMKFMIVGNTSEEEADENTQRVKKRKKNKPNDDDLVSVIRSVSDIQNQSILIVSYDFLSKNIEYFQSYHLDGRKINDRASSSYSGSFNDEISDNLITNQKANINNKNSLNRTSTISLNDISSNIITNFNIKRKINFIICDEAHYLKTRVSKRSQAIVPFLKSVNRVVLCTGTPALSRPAELYVLVDVLSGFNYRDFTNRYCVFSNNANNSRFSKYNQFKGCSNETELKLVLSKLMVRRTKNELMKDMPKKRREHYILDCVIHEDFAPSDESYDCENGHILNEEAYDKNCEIAEKNEEISWSDEDYTQLKAPTVNTLRNYGMKSQKVKSSTDQTNSRNSSKSTRNSVLNEDTGAANPEKLRTLPKPQTITRPNLSEANLLSDPAKNRDIMELYRSTALVKVESVNAYLTKWLERNEEKVVVFAHHKVMLNGIESGIKEFFDKQNDQKIFDSTERKVQERETDYENVNENERKAKITNLNTKNCRPDDENDQNFKSNGPERAFDSSSTTNEKNYLVRIDGNTPLHVRQSFVNSFQTDPHCKVILLSLTSASTGITLTAAHNVIFTELWWNPGTILQAEDRVHRIGQRNDVNVIFLLGRNTVDEVVWPMVVRKLKVLEKMEIGKNEFKNVRERIGGDLKKSICRKRDF